MNQIRLDKWDQFEERLCQLQNERQGRQKSTGPTISPFLFRGQTNSGWQLLTTLERNGWQGTLREYYQRITAVQPQLETFTRKAWTDVPEYPNGFDKWLNENDRLMPLGFPAYG